MKDQNKSPKIEKDIKALPSAESVPTAKEYGGREGLDPARYGDWEIKGKCVDF
jgi:hypothetical protein